VKGRYPLDALAKLRRQAVDVRVREVAEQAAKVDRARREQDAARLRRERAVQSAISIQGGERARLEAGEARAADLAAEASWRAAEQRRLALLANEERKRAETAAREAREESAARGRLAGAEAESKAVEKHHERWKIERSRVLEEREAEVVEDMFAAKRGQGGR
jgi:hypothetical protein